MGDFIIVSVVAVALVRHEILEGREIGREWNNIR